jgi:MoaF C-terminal domain/MoaF N-terminal domain
MDKPSDWKDYDDFAAGIDTNRLPRTDALAGQEFTITLASGDSLSYTFNGPDSMSWNDAGGSGQDWYEAVNVAADVFFVDTVYAARPRDARTLIVNIQTRRVLSILSHVRQEKIEGEPLVTQKFEAGVLGDPTVPPRGMQPAPTRDLVGLRAFYRYSPNHLYEHIYLSSERYAWQNLIGEQRGHGDVDLATTYKFDEKQYVFTFREFIIPVASVFFYNWDDMRSTGKFLGVTGDGRIENNPAGAYIQMASMTYYDKAWEPV